jgi:hypothetical protein
MKLLQSALELQADSLLRKTRRRPRTILRSGRTVVGSPMNSSVNSFDGGITEMKNPICVDDESCKEGVTKDWQPDAIEDGSIEDTKDCSRIKHTLQLANVNSKDYPEASVSLPRFGFEDVLES